jgi:hypothetical protein
MASGLHLSPESVRRDNKAEVGLAGSAALHCLVMSVKMRVIEDLERRRLQGGGDLDGGGGNNVQPQLTSLHTDVASPWGRQVGGWG